MPIRATSTVRAWRGIDALAREAEGARELLRTGSIDPLCNDATWLEAHARSFAEHSDEILGWTVLDGDTPIGFLPMRIEPKRARFALKRAILSSDGTFDSDYLDIPVAPGREVEVAELLLDAMASERNLQAIVLAGVPNTSPILEPLRSALEKRKLPVRERPGDCLAAPLPATFDEYLAGLKKRMRSKVRQARRKAEEAGATFHWCTEPASFEQHLEGLFELHGERWKEAGHGGSFADERRRALYASMTPTYHDRGMLRFCRLELDGRAIAYQYGLRAGETYYQLQEGYLPEIDQFRSATALRGMAIEELIEEGVRSYDFMAGATRHKTDWGGLDRPCTTLAFALPRLRARFAYGLRAWQDRRATAQG